jgi:hypothetical protein
VIKMSLLSQNVRNKTVSAGVLNKTVSCGTFKYIPPGGLPQEDLNYWWDANRGITIPVSTISQWDDLSGNNNNLVQALEASQPTLLTNEIGTKSVVQFPSPTSMGIASQTRDDFTDSDGKSFSTFFIYKQDTNTSSSRYIMFWAKDTIERFLIAFYNLGTRTFIQCGNSTTGQGRILSNTAPTDRNTAYYITGIRRNGNAIEVRWYKNGTEQLNIVTTLTDGLPTGTDNFLMSPTGRLGELAHYPRAVTDLEFSQAISYLTNKWGI